MKILEPITILSKIQRENSSGRRNEGLDKTPCDAICVEPYYLIKSYRSDTSGAQSKEDTRIENAPYYTLKVIV
jgi:hypothetical protein